VCHASGPFESFGKVFIIKTLHSCSVTCFKIQKWLQTKTFTISGYFMAQFFLLFQMEWSILFRVLAPETTFWLLKNLQQPTRPEVYLCSFMANTLNKMAHTMWKSLKNCVMKWCHKLCTICLRPLVPLERCAIKKRKQKKFPQAGGKLTRRSCTQSRYVCL